MTIRILLLTMLFAVTAFAQVPPIEPGVSQELAKWRAVRYSNVRYKLNLTLEKMSPVLKGSMEIRLQYAAEACAECPPRFIVLDWRRIKGHEEKSGISNVFVNGKAVSLATNWPPANAGGSDFNEHLIFSDGVVMGENVIKLDFTSPILTSGSAITRYVDKEDGSEYLYSLFVPSDASTAFPVFDQPDIKARFKLYVYAPDDWKVIGNSEENVFEVYDGSGLRGSKKIFPKAFKETKPISTYVFAFAAGPWERVAEPPALAGGQDLPSGSRDSTTGASPPAHAGGSAFFRKSQLTKFKPHAAEVFRLNREAIKYFEEYFDYKFPFPKYDLVLIPEFPFGGMEHAGATFLRESSIIFPQEPTKNDHINRATLIFHEAAHQWFGDTVTMRWFDDLWLKEGFATFMGYKAMEKIMPEMNAWKVFYERIKQGAYATDSTKGTTAIYQPIANLSAAKSAYGNIVYNKAPAFLRQAEFYLGEAKFQMAVRAFLKKNEFGNATWQDLVGEFERSSGQNLQEWAQNWVTRAGMTVYRANQTKSRSSDRPSFSVYVTPREVGGDRVRRPLSIQTFSAFVDPAKAAKYPPKKYRLTINGDKDQLLFDGSAADDTWDEYYFLNYQDYGYGIFLLDDMSREYVLKNIQNEKDPFLRSMMWGALWDSVREGELDPREFVELVVRVLMHKPDREGGRNDQVGSTALTDVRAFAIDDESTTALLLSRVGTAMNHYLSEPPASAGGQSGNGSGTGTSPNWPAANAAGSDLRSRVEEMLIGGIRNAETLGQRITYYRAFLNIASSENARAVLKGMLWNAGTPAGDTKKDAAKYGGVPLKAKDKFDIVTKLLILNDPEGPKLLADLEKAETGDDAKRYAYAARAGIPTAENRAKYWNDFVNNKDISESWIEAAFGPWNSIRHSELTLPYLERALKELPNHKRNRKIFFVNGWLGAFIGGQRSEEALAAVNKFLADNPDLDNDLRLKILENVDVIERAVRIRGRYK